MKMKSAILFLMLGMGFLVADNSTNKENLERLNTYLKNRAQADNANQAISNLLSKGILCATVRKLIGDPGVLLLNG